ncbi:VOC family protein [Brachybacterium huguangmaarense]
MVAPQPYILFPGTAREALEHYRAVFGGDAELVLHTYEEFGRDDGPADAIAHGMVRGPVDLYAADAASGERSVTVTGLMLSLLGAAEPATLRAWFAALADGGQVIDDLQEREWVASDGVVRDRFGLTWLIGYEGTSD